jgi:hypothetical protein
MVDVRGMSLCRLTFELSGRQRQGARARTEKMYTVPQAGPWRPAVGAPLEREVRRQHATERTLVSQVSDQLEGQVVP